MYIQRIGILNQSIFPVSGLTSYWRLEEASGTIYDSKGSVNSTAENSILYQQTGKKNYCIASNAAGDYVNFGSSAYNFERTDKFSFSFWWKYTTTGAGMIMAKQQNASPYKGWGIINSNGEIYFNISAGATWATGKILSGVAINNFAHYVITYAGTSLVSGMKFYVNGVDKSVTNLNDTLAASTTTSFDTQFFSRSGGYTAIGSLDEMGIWNRVLSLQEAKDIYNLGTGIYY